MILAAAHEMDNEGSLHWTEFGFAEKADKPPGRRDVFWLTNTGQIYAWDGDGWYRIKPPDRVPFPEGDLNHG